MKVQKTNTGSWLDKEKLQNGDIVKLVSEPIFEEGNFGSQLVGHVRVKGWTTGAEKIGINAPSKNALIEAFGDDTTLWVDKLLTVNVVESILGGKSVIILYLIPEQFARTKDSGGYIVIKPSSEVIKENRPAIARNDEEIAEDINVDDIPF